MLLSTMNCDGGSMILTRMSCMEIESADLGRWGWGREREYGSSLKLIMEIC